MKSVSTFLAAAMSALILGFSFVAAPPARALEPVLETAKMAGSIGECVDGFLYVRTSADPSIERLVSEVNAKRRAYYADLAESGNASIAEVATLTGEKNIALQPVGVYVRGLDGNWQKK